MQTSLGVSVISFLCSKISSDWDSDFDWSCLPWFFPIYLVVSMPYTVVLALGKARLAFSLGLVPRISQLTDCSDKGTMKWLTRNWT